MYDDSPLIKTIVVGVLIAVVSTTLFGATLKGALFRGLLHSSVEIVGVVIAKTIGDELRSGSHASSRWWATRGHRVDAASAAEPQTFAVIAPEVPGYAGFCGVTPDGTIYCCEDQLLKPYIEYVGKWNPYQYRGVRYSCACYR